MVDCWNLGFDYNRGDLLCLVNGVRGDELSCIGVNS